MPPNGSCPLAAAPQGATLPLAARPWTHQPPCPSGPPAREARGVWQASEAEVWAPKSPESAEPA
eukprot:6172934-Pyramimonas_sp.AAC.1